MEIKVGGRPPIDRRGPGGRATPQRLAGPPLKRLGVVQPPSWHLGAATATPDEHQG
jgi:hypothetical protein